jgi:hypothetical protein
MDQSNIVAGMNILRKYRAFGSTKHELQKAGPYQISNVLCENVSFEDQQKLVALGWEGVDDWMGFRASP